MSNHTDALTVSTVDPDEAPRRPASPLQLPPLTISALMVTKADLVQALRIYLPNIADIEAIDGDRFLLTVSGAVDQNGERSMTDGIFDNVYVATGAVGGVIRFDTAGAGPPQGYAIYRSGNSALQFQGGTGGYLFVNSGNSAIVLKMTDGGDVGVGAAVPLARLEVRAAAGNLETLALSGDSQSTITLRNKAATSEVAAVVSSNYGGGVSASTARVESAGGFAVGVGVTTFHTGSRVVLNIPNDGINGRVQLRAAGAGPTMLQLQSSTASGSVDLLGFYAIHGAPETRINALSSLSLGSGSGDYVGNVEVMRLTPGKKVGIGTSDPQAKLEVRAPANATEALNLIAGGNGGGDLPALTWKNAAGTLLMTQWTDGASGHSRIKSKGTLYFHTDLNESNRWGPLNERMRIGQFYDPLSTITHGVVGINSSNPITALQVDNGGLTVNGEPGQGTTNWRPGRVSAKQFYAFKADNTGATKIADGAGCYYA